MKKDKDTSGVAASLRQRAVEKLRAVAGADYLPVSEPDVPRQVQELQIHQIELEMQNEELRQSHLAVEKGLEQYSELYDFAPVGYFTLDPQGNIYRANLAGESLLGVNRSLLGGRRFGFYVLPESRPIFVAFLDRVFESHEKQTCEVALQAENTATFYVRIDGAVSTNGECHLVVMDITERKQVQEALLSLKARLGDHDVYSLLVEQAADGFWLLDKQFRTVYVNPALEEMLGYTHSEMIGRSWYDFGDPEWTARARELERRRESGVGEPHDFLFIHKSGRKVLTRIATTPLYDKDGSFDGAIGVLSDITRQKEADEALRIKDLLNAVAQSSGLGICLINPDYTIAWYNDVHSQWYGALEKTKGRNCFEVFEGRDAICSECPVRVSFETGATTMTERSGITTSVGVNRTITLSTAPICDADGNVLQVVETVQDITARKQAEEARALTARLLLEIGTPGDFRECMASLTFALQTWSGCEAVGIRLQAGDDYPYYETRGFPSEFVQEENQLCAYDQNNQVVRDSAGTPILECMCGNILCGRFDPDKPFFTAGGSFWSNCTTALLASTTDADRQTRTRNRCNSEGYESVALIPLRTGQQVFGLLQFNDHRTNRFTLDLIEQMESLADSLAIALSRRQSEQALHKSEERLQLAHRSAGAGTWEWDMTSQRVAWSKELCTLFGRNPEEAEVSFDTWRQSLHPDDRESASCVLENAVKERTPLATEYRIIHPNGQVHWISALGDTVYDPSGQPVRMAGICTDITERKQSEEALRKSEARLKTIFESSPLGIALIDSLTGQVYSANPMFAKIAGRTIAEMEHIDWMSITHPDDIQKDLDNMALLNSGKINGFQMEKRYIHPDGTPVWINLTVAPVYVKDKAQPRHLAMIEDITARKQADEALRAASLYSRNLIETSLDPMVTISAKGKITDVNKATESITGVSRDRLIGSDFADYFAQPDIARAGYLKAFELGQIADYPLAIRHASGAVAQVLYNVSVYRDDEGKVQGVFAAARDITDLKRTQSALQNERDNLAAIFASSPIGLLLLDEELMAVDANNAIAVLVSRSPREIIRQRGGGALSCKHSLENEKGCGFSPECPSCPFMQALNHALKDGASTHGVEVEMILLIDGREQDLWLKVSTEPILINGRRHIIVAMDDITVRKRAEQALIQANDEIDIVNRELEDALAISTQYAESLETAKGEIEDNAIEFIHQATHDSLTDLPNRQYFEQHLCELITRSAGKKSSSITVLYLDLDKFKLINDTLGHKIGDLLLIQVADRLQLCLRSEDLLARMGGDEFTVILSRSNDRSMAQLVASRILDSLSRPFEIQDHRFVTGASIGLARYPNDGQDTVALLRHADAAMYKAKQSGRGRYCWYSGDVDVENQQRADMEMDIRLALDTGQFSVYYQPIIRVEDGNVFAAEALLRWEHPDKGMIPPSLFVPIAEEIGVIGPIGDFVLRESCAQVMAWRDEGIHLSQIGVNVSADQVRDANWLASVRSALSDTGLDAGCLNLELTESGFATDILTMKRTLRKVQELGVCMAIDDFGTGQSSLSRLKSFPVLHLKIDGSFIRDIEYDKSDNAMVRSIIEMAHSQGMMVTAEWVETEPQMEILRSIGCDYAQGYYISPALPAEAFHDFVCGHRRHTKS